MPRTALIMSMASIAAGCSSDLEVQIPFPVDRRIGTEILFIEQGDHRRAIAVSLEEEAIALPGELRSSAPIELQAMIFEETPELLGLDTEVPELPAEVVGRTPLETYALNIRDGRATPWVQLQRPGPRAERFLPPPPPEACARFLSEPADIFPPPERGTEEYFVNAFAIDARTAMIVSIDPVPDVPVFRLATATEVPERLSIDTATFAVREAEYSAGTIWLVGWNAGRPALATVSRGGDFRLLSGEPPRFLTDLAAAREGDAFALFGLDNRGGVHGYDRTNDTWTQLGALDVDIMEGNFGHLVSLGVGEFLAIDNAGCAVHHLPGSPTAEDTPIRTCGEAGERFMGLEHLEGVGTIAGTNAGEVLLRDPAEGKWRDLLDLPLVFGSNHLVVGFAANERGFLVGGSRGSVHQYLLPEAMACYEGLTIEGSAYVKKMIPLDIGWVAAGYRIDLTLGADSPEQVFIARFFVL